MIQFDVLAQNGNDSQSTIRVNAVINSFFYQSLIMQQFDFSAG